MKRTSGATQYFPLAKRQKPAAAWAAMAARKKRELKEDVEDKKKKDTTVVVAVTSAGKAAAASMVAKPPMPLSVSQQRVLRAAMSGESFFFTGAAGTGKSYVLKQLPGALAEKFGESTIFTTASTGIAACAIGGTTLHSFAGVGLGDGSVAELLERLQNPKQPSYKKARARWVMANVLIIEECSMVPPDLFDKLDQIGRCLRGVFDKPFGGIQVILCGDFYQLPPVNKEKRPDQMDFIFETKSWNQLIGDKIYVLTEIFRQKEPEFLNMLEDFRRGSIGDQAMATFETRRRVTEMTSALPDDTVKLFSTRKEVEIVNNYNLDKLGGEIKNYDAVDRGEPFVVQKLADHWITPQRLTLKVGASVMFVFNVAMELGISNGMTGKVVGFSDDKEFPIILCANGVQYTAEPVTWEIKSASIVIAARTQIPLILSYAITTHKSQGMSINHVEVNTSNFFEHGQCYVALSRGMTLEGLYIRGPLPAQRLLHPHPKVVNWWQAISQ